jgi:hypothetical protein
MGDSPPFVKALFNMQVDAMPEDLFLLLYSTEIRKEWDKSVAEFYEIEKIGLDVVKYYMLNKAPWPFTDRDFVEMRYCRRKENGDIEIYYKESESEEVKEREIKVERGKTLFGGQIFRSISEKGMKSLMVTLISQADMGGKIPPKALKDTLPLSLINWHKAVRKELLKRFPESALILE